MPFFPQVYLSPEANFLQILSELDHPRESQPKTCVPRQQAAKRQPTFTPRFDVMETEQSYELYGELPGLEQSKLDIEFSDAQTLLIKGQTERPSSTNPAPEASQSPQVESEKTADGEASETSSVKSHTATVEDDYDEADTPLKNTVAPALTTATTATTSNQQPQQKQSETPKPQFWASERRVGSFARSFSFSQRVDHDAVQASLKNGVLHVVVPKTAKRARIPVNVY